MASSGVENVKTQPPPEKTEKREEEDQKEMEMKQ